MFAYIKTVFFMFRDVQVNVAFRTLLIQCPSTQRARPKLRPQPTDLTFKVPSLMKRPIHYDKEKYNVVRSFVQIFLVMCSIVTSNLSSYSRTLLTVVHSEVLQSLMAYFVSKILAKLKFRGVRNYFPISSGLKGLINSSLKNSSY